MALVMWRNYTNKSLIQYCINSISAVTVSETGVPGLLRAVHAGDEQGLLDVST